MLKHLIRNYKQKQLLIDIYLLYNTVHISVCLCWNADLKWPGRKLVFLNTYLQRKTEKSHNVSCKTYA